MKNWIYALMTVFLLSAAPSHAKRPFGFYPPPERPFGFYPPADSLNSDESMVSNAEVTRAPQIITTCENTGRNSMQCHVRNIGNDAGETCVDVVKICKYGEHVATVCSGRLNPGAVDSKVITAFLPKVLLLEKCAGIEFRNSVNY